MSFLVKIGIAVFLLCMTLAAPAQDAGKRERGRFTGSLESNTILYVSDHAIHTDGESQTFGSNNYLKGDYTRGRFSAGLQMEYYPIPLKGYPSELKGIGLTGKYIAWTDRNWGLTVGDFYEQFGSGLLFRSWEDRELGLNNSIGGGRLTFRTANQVLAGKVLVGAPRYYLRSQGQGYGLTEHFLDAYARTVVSGGELSLSLTRLLAPASGHSFSLEGSILNRHEQGVPEEMVILGALHGFTIPTDVLSYSARMNWSWADFSVMAEYVGKGKDFYAEHSDQETFSLKRGEAQLVEINYARGSFSGAVTLRRLSNMQNTVFRTVQGIAAANTLNYLPALCQQQTYMLASLNPYTTYADGETGGQFDLFYNFRRGSKLGGKYGMKLHLNGSMIYALPEALPDQDEWRMAYRDITGTVEKTWNRKFKTIFFVSIQENSPTHGNGIATNAQNVFVLDMQYKFTSRVALRTELQYLYSEELTRDWMAGLTELTFAPRWSIYLRDMYNHGDTRIHYYSAGVGYSHSQFRLALNYGRNKEGMVCSGGVCRWQPAYTGGTFQLQWLF